MRKNGDHHLLTAYLIPIHINQLSLHLCCIDITMCIKLLVVQLLLLLLICNRTEGSKELAELTFKGGFFNCRGDYVVDAYHTIEINVKIVAENTSCIAWNIDDHANKPKLPTVTQEHLLRGNQSVLSSTVRFVAHKRTTTATWHLERKGFQRVHSHSLKLFPQYPTPPEITFTHHGGSYSAGDGVYRYKVNDAFSLNCACGGLSDFNITWVDSNGVPVTSDNVTTKLGSVMRKDLEDQFNVRDQFLHVSAQEGMESFGCRMYSPSYNNSTYNVTRWFNFTVGSQPNVELIMGNSSCGRIDLSCFDGGKQPDQVEFEIIKLIKSLIINQPTLFRFYGSWTVNGGRDRPIIH